MKSWKQGCSLWLVAVLATVGLSAAPNDARLADAAQNHDRALVRSLLKDKADVNGLQADRTTALMWASHWGDLETVELLLKAGANPKLINRYGTSALTEAADNYVGSIAVIEALLKAGADPNTRATNDETPLMAVSLAGGVNAVKLLLDRGADINARNKYDQETALMYAAAESRADVVKLLISRGADVNVVAHTLELSRGHNNDERLGGGLTALMFAARQNCLECAKALIDGGANIHASDRDGMTPMTIAAMNNSFETGALILDRGGDPNDGTLWEVVNFRNFEDQTEDPNPVITSQMDALVFEKMLLDHGADPTRPYGKIHTGTNRGATVGTGITNTSPLDRAVKDVDVETVRMMLDHSKTAGIKFDPNAILANLLRAYAAVGPTVRLGGGEDRAKLEFRIVTPKDAADAVAVCADHGADVNSANLLGNTPLHLAAQQGLDDAVKVLVARGAKVDAKNKAGLMPVDFAMGKGGSLRARGQDEVGEVKEEVYEGTAALLRQLMAGPSAAGAVPVKQ